MRSAPVAARLQHALQYFAKTLHQSSPQVHEGLFRIIASRCNFCQAGLSVVLSERLSEQVTQGSVAAVLEEAVGIASRHYLTAKTVADALHRLRWSVDESHRRWVNVLWAMLRDEQPYRALAPKAA
jgi:hypothetical protein